MNVIPDSVRACLWSYDTEAIDQGRDKQRIIFNVLNYGSDEAARWLFATYSQKDLADVVTRSAKSAWSRKSLAFWMTVLKTSPQRASRFG